jgi:hypothetical protein
MPDAGYLRWRVAVFLTLQGGSDFLNEGGNNECLNN